MLIPCSLEKEREVVLSEEFFAGDRLQVEEKEVLVSITLPTAKEVNAYSENIYLRFEAVKRYLCMSGEDTFT